MAAQKRPATSRGKAKATAVAYPMSAVTVATRNLLNMAVVTACCGTVLLGLMIVKHF
jgi:hypothetical protein